MSDKQSFKDFYREECKNNNWSIYAHESIHKTRCFFSLVRYIENNIGVERSSDLYHYEDFAERNNSND